MNLQIQRLSRTDTALLRQLNAMFAQAFGDPDTYLGAPPDDTYCAQALAQPQLIALAALLDGAVVGGAVAYELPKLERARSEVYLYDLAVAETHRRKGIATRLIERLRAIAHERGAWVVFVLAYLGDDPAMAWYTKLGLRVDVLHFDLRVPLHPGA